MLSIDFFKKLNWAFGLMALGVLFGVAAFCSTVEIKDLDLWLHIKTGEFIVQNGFVPSFDVLSCSFFGKPWINHEWLFQVIVYLVQNGWGMDGLIYMQTGIVVLTFLIFLLLAYERDRQLLIVPLLFIVLQVYQTRFTIRPDIFSLLFFASYIYILSIHINKRWSLWVLFVLQVLWTNIHGYSLFGVVFVLIGLAAEFIKRRMPLPYAWNNEGRLTDDEYRRLQWIFLAVILATLINPLTFKGAWYPVSVLLGLSGDSKIFFQYITELKRPLSWATLFNVEQQWPFKALILISFITFVLNRKKIDLSALFFWLAFLIFSLSALRNMVYFAFAAYLVSMLNISNVRLYDVLPLRFVQERFLYLTGWMLSILFIVVLFNYGDELSFNGYYDFDKYERKSEYLGICQRNFPDKAADFLVKNEIKGNFFNDFNSGAYLIGRAYPNIRVYIDGRTELRGSEFFKNYKYIWDDGDEKLFDAAARQCGFVGAFVNTAGAPAPAAFLKMMDKKKDWKIVYFDYDAVIFLKDIPENAERIKRFEIDLSSWQPKELDLRRLGTARTVPYRNLSRAHTLKSLGRQDQALAEAEAALKVFPSYEEAYKVRGDIYAERKEFERAFESYRIASVYAAGNIDYKNDLAFAYIDLGEYKYAMDQAEKVIASVPNDPRAYFILAKALLKNKQYQKGYDILLQALSRDSKALDDILKLGNICLNDKAFDWALKIDALVLRRDDKNANAYESIGDIYKDKGDAAMALKTWEKSLALRSDNDGLKKKVEDLKAGIR